MSIAMTEITVRVGQELTKKQLAEINEGAKYPITYDPECPPSTDKALAEFAAKARAFRAKNKSVKPSVTIRIDRESLEAYKSLGKGYTGIMADVLKYVAGQPEILQNCYSRP